MSDYQQPGPDGTPPRNQYAQHAQAAADRAKAAAQDALGAARRLITNPAGAIGSAHAGLGGDRVLGVAIVFAVIAALGLAFASNALASSFIAFMSGGYGGYGGGFHFMQFLKASLMNLIGIAAIGGGILIMAPLLGGRSNPASALFIAATAVLPFALAAIAATIVGWVLKNQLGGLLIMLLMLYGLCYLIMVLNAGLRQVAGIDESRAAFGTPTVLAIAMLVMWLVGKLLS